MKTALTNLPQMASNVKICLKNGKLTRVYLAPKVVEEVAPAEVVVESPAYAKAARDLDEAVAVLAAVFEPVVRKVARPRSVPTSVPAAAIIASAKIYAAPKVAPRVTQAPVIDYGAKGSLGNNRGFSLL